VRAFSVRIAISLLILSALAGVLTFVYGDGSHEGAVRIGVNQSPPYMSIDADGTPRGFGVAVLSEAARRRGIRLAWVVVREGTDLALASGKVDVWPFMTETPARRGRIFFTDPYLQTRFSLLLPIHSNMRSLDDAAGRRIVHSSLAVTGRLAAEFFPRSTLVATAPGEEMQAICRGTADGAFIEHKKLMQALLARPPECSFRNFEILPIAGASFDTAIGSSRAGRGTAKALRAEITEMSRAGTLDKLFEEWLLDTSDEARIVFELREVNAANERSRLLCGGVVLLGVSLILLLMMMRRRRLAQKAVKSAYDFASVALDSAGGLVLICDRHGRILRFNRACERASGKTLSAVQGKTTWELLVKDDEKAAVRTMFEQLGDGTGHSDHEHHWQTANGLRLFSWSNTTLKNENGRVDYIIATGIDITTREETQERLGYEAMHDALTGLANRRCFRNELDTAVAAALQGEPGFAVALADLDRFKLINDTYGHAAGDDVLVFFARAVREELAPEDLAGRLGGDEFGFILRGPFARNRVECINRRLREQIFRARNGQTFRAGATFGLAVWTDAMRPSEVLGAADEALYRAKRERLLPVSHFHADPAGQRSAGDIASLISHVRECK
jgi:diguanylate cyclase (GGDEF)-like protein/PAS domain S-box-containing protein